MTIEQTLEAAVQHHQAGRIAQAQDLYRQVLAQQPEQPDALHLLGVLAYQAGQPRTALDLVRRAVALNPAAPDFQINLGEILCSTGRTDEAIAAYRAAARLSPRSALAYNGLSIALLARGQLAEALDAARRAIELQPDYPQAHNNLGNILHARKELDSAIASYRHALALRPSFAQAANNLAVLLRDRGQLDEAISLLRDALAQHPDYADAHNNLGVALASAGRIDDAIECYHRAVAIRPAFAEAFNNLGNALHDRGEIDAAQAAFQKALDLRPDFFEALLNLAKLLRESDLTDEAIATARAALVLRPDDPAALNQLALAHGDRDQGDEALRLLQRAIEHSPQFDQAHNNLGNLYKDRGQLDQALASYDRAIALRRDRADYLGNRIFCMQYHEDLDARAQRDYRQLWDQRHAQPLSGLIRPHANDRSADRRLRIGYVSPDFREHCQSFFTIPLLRSHDHERFEIICYSSVRRPDAVTAKLRGRADVWHEVAHLSDAQLADAIRADRIDILVDLTMHMSGGRLLTFAAKPAPVQVTWLAYPGSTGLSAMDYRLTDPFLDPPGADESIYSERSLRLPDTFWCYDPRDDLAPSELPASRQTGITFGCLNNFCKVNQSVLKLWAAVLGKVVGSRLLILSPAGAHREAATATLAQHGVDPSRIQWLDRRPRSNYLQLYHLLDICLDTFPYNGHTTSLDAMWMGVPVVTRVGPTVVGRAGWSQLSNMDLTDLAASTDEQFVTIAANLAADIPRLAELRRTLRQRMAGSPLMDAPRFARGVEAVYCQMWQAWCGGEPARP